ncbi:MAG TPA: GGDEF domain-containing protein [Capillimicrobium sp.]|jgi:diguanylate cyclase (GGDEF)-like protein
MDSPSAADALAFLRGSRRAYMAAALDMRLMRRVIAIAYALTGLCSLVVLAFVPPVELVGTAAGWAIGLGYVAFCAVASWWVLRSGRITLPAVYASSLAMLVGLGLVGWVAQDGDLYTSVPLLVLIVVAAVFPPREVAIALAVALVAQLPALAAIGADTDSVVELLLHFFIFGCLCALALLWTAGIRLQGAAMHSHARVDALTGLGNRRAFDEALAAELARAVRSGQALSLLVGDLDAFKTINDRHGHLAGDACLQDVASVVQDLTRRPDSCFRWGGDEFAVLLPEAGAERARAVADRLATAVRRACRTPDGSALTIAFGVAERGTDEADPAALLARADHDLMAVKAGGPQAARLS